MGRPFVRLESDGENDQGDQRDDAGDLSYTGSGGGNSGGDSDGGLHIGGLEVGGLDVGGQDSVLGGRLGGRLNTGGRHDTGGRQGLSGRGVVRGDAVVSIRVSESSEHCGGGKLVADRGLDALRSSVQAREHDVARGKANVLGVSAASLSVVRDVVVGGSVGGGDVAVDHGLTSEGVAVSSVGSVGRVNGRSVAVLAVGISAGESLVLGDKVHKGRSIAVVGDAGSSAVLESELRGVGVARASDTSVKSDVVSTTAAEDLSLDSASDESSSDEERAKFHHFVR